MQIDSYYKKQVLVQYYIKSYTGKDTSVCFQYWYSGFYLGIPTCPALLLVIFGIYIVNDASSPTTLLT